MAAADATLPPLLRQPAFRRFWAGQSISVLGDQVTTIALPLAAVLTLDASAFQVGLLTTLLTLPHLLFSLQAGEWLDRYGHRQQVMVASDIARAAVLLSIPIAYWLDGLLLGHLFAAAFLVGTLAVFFDLSWNTLFAAIVPRRDFVVANARLSQSRAVAQGVGPSIGGVLVELVRAPGALVVDALSYIGSAFFISRIRAQEPPVEAGPAMSIVGRLSVGMRFLFRHPLTRATLLAVATLNLFNLMFVALFVLYATRELGITPGVLGLILGAGAVGAAIGAIIAPRVSAALGVGRALMLGAVLFPAPLMLVPAAAGPDPVVIAMLVGAGFFASLGVMIFDVNGNSLMVAATPDRIRARVVGAHRTINYGIRPIGALLGGSLAAWIGLQPTLWIATAGALLGVLWLVSSPVPSLKTLPEQLE